MLNAYYISSFNIDIKKHMVHYFLELITTEEDSFTLFQYGPYIAMNYDIKDYNTIMSTNKFKNPLFRLMVEVSYIIKLNTMSNSSVGFIKNKLL